MLDTISNWYNLWKFKKLSKRLLNEDTNFNFYSDILLWFDESTKYISLDKLYRKRLVVEFENIIELGKALDILYFNISNGFTSELKSQEKKLLLDDWLIDDESVRVNIGEFVEKYRNTFMGISKKLEDLDDADKQYYLLNFYAIIVTLRSYVEVCHRR
ncbi:hypothetical protein TSMG0069 [Halocynthia phage JM-2012]|uniref:hypothetical protein n=1 Tax=Halocynthia phage JM-2012 TaxID=1173297 RepID=UPI00025C6919|nr:hypothetical protein TSMG0069 [Halocynthia phage JM-2012]AFI55352.1 hypothetical protein TSMG0069 [Halocynthia phage JM-2012]